MKPFRPNEELIKLLESRNLNIPNHNFAMRMLNYENYYYIINGYKDIFINSTIPDDAYKPNASFNEIVALYTFDRRLRELLLIELLRVEHVLKTKIVSVFSEHHGHDHTSYLRPESFNVNGFTNFKRTNSMIFEMLKLIDKQKKGTVQSNIIWIIMDMFHFGYYQKL